MADDGALDGDLDLEAGEAEAVKGGMRVSCSACGHSHAQSDAKCNVRCGVHGSGGSTFY